MLRIALSLVVATLLVGSIVAAVLKTRGETIAQHDAAVASCERTNVLRQAAYDNFNTDAISREVAATQFSGESKAELIAAAAANRASARALVDAVRGVALKPGSPQLDCAAAFGK